MIVEHTFITTRPAPEAFAAAGELLASLKFDASGQPTESSREWRRGRTDPRRARGMSDLPQRIRLEFDRGRVSVAGSLELRHKRQQRAGDAIVAITVALEQMLAHGQPAQAAGAEPLARQARIAALDRRHQIILWSCVAAPIILGLLAFAIVTARDITTFEFGPSKARASHR